jgi:peptide/nickel transport system substrate-binding protein
MMWNPVKPADPMKPWLATKAEWSKDYTSVKVTIRDNATWSDGQKVTADDVAFTYNLIMKYPALNNQGVPYTGATVSGNDVTITMSTPQFVSQQKVLWRVLIVPKHIWEKISDPTTDPVKQPIGSGPYTLKSFTPATATLTVRDSGYWQDLPKVKELRFTSYTDNQAQTTALANGESEWSFVFIPNYKAVFVDKDPANHKVWAPPVLGIHGLYINTTKAPFDDPVLRRAMNMAINREDIFTTAEAAYFHPLVKSVTGLPAPPATRSSHRSTRGRTTRWTSRVPRRCSPAPGTSSTAPFSRTRPATR